MSESSKPPPGRTFERLVAIMRRLRGPEGCPWDREQDWRSLRRYTLEEAYEVVHAIDVGDDAALAGELGDLLLQIVFLAQIGAEEGRFDIVDVTDSISDKLVRRHPHVFGDADVTDAADVVRVWEAIKRDERPGGSLLDDVPLSLPALERGQKLGKRAAQMPFDWAAAADVRVKVDEELAELDKAMATGRVDQVEEELGDLLLTLTSLARHLGVSAELALTGACAKFERRFRRLEEAVGGGQVAGDPVALEAGWKRIKSAMPAPPGDGGDADSQQIQDEQRYGDE